MLTAAAADQVALEGYKGHGVFTYALLDALSNGDTNNNGQIELSELAAHIQTLAPRLSRELSTGGTRCKPVARVSAGRRPAVCRPPSRVRAEAEDRLAGRRLPAGPAFAGARRWRATTVISAAGVALAASAVSLLKTNGMAVGRGARPSSPCRRAKIASRRRD